MSDELRWKYGETNPVLAAVDSGTVIEIGDLLYLDTDDAKPASSMSDAGTEAQNQAAFAQNFLGVAMQRSRSGDTAPIRVATSGVFEFDCSSGTWELGATVGGVGATTLADQTVKAAATTGAAIGVVVQREAVAVTNVRVAIKSNVAHLVPKAAVVAALGGTITGTTDGDLADIAATAGSCAGGSTPTASNVDTAIATAVASIVTGTNTNLKEIQTTLNAVLTALKNANLMASA